VDVDPDAGDVDVAIIVATTTAITPSTTTAATINTTAATTTATITAATKMCTTTIATTTATTINATTATLTALHVVILVDAAVAAVEVVTEREREEPSPKLNSGTRQLDVVLMGLVMVSPVNVNDF